MLTLLILRHAKSSWDDRALDDHDRPLNERGQRDAPLMGRFVRDQRLRPDLILSSDAVRARLTAEMVARAAGYTGRIRLEPRLYLASAADIIDVLRTSIERGVTTVMTVGHNPGLEELVARLTGTREDLPTAALVQIVLPIEQWSDLDDTMRGTLVSVWRPRDVS
jgi:phosphohistidine phosphatase